MALHPPSIATAAAVFCLASSALSAPPVSRGEQYLRITQPECMQRASMVFQAQGWTNIGGGGSMVYANKGIHSAYITCNGALDGSILANVFVASDVGGADVPGAERVALQQGMTGAMAAPPTPLAGTGQPLEVQKFGDGRIRAIWRGSPGGSGDWMSVVPVGTPDSTHVGQWRYAPTTSGYFDFGPYGAGNYELRFYLNDSYVVASRVGFSLP
jgi:hypothetical protein